jgi:membrane-bound serine protease (ClpP class)
MISKRSFTSFCARAFIFGLVASFASMLGPLGSAGAAAAPRGAIDFAELTGLFDSVSSRFLIGQVDQAEKTGSEALIVRVDSISGLVSPAAAVARIRSSKVPVVVWVAPRGARAKGAAGSLAAAAHLLVLSPGARLHAARAADFVTASPRTLLDDLNGRRVMVRGGPVTINTSSVRIRFHKMGFFQRVLHWGSSSEVAYLLLLVGMCAVIFELYYPGAGAVAVFGGGCLALSFYSLVALPVRWWAVGLVVAGVGAQLLDLHRGGFGLFSIGGLAAVGAGGWLMLAGAPAGVRPAWWTPPVAVAGSLLFFVSIMTAAIRSRSARP